AAPRTPSAAGRAARRSSRSGPARRGGLGRAWPAVDTGTATGTRSRAVPSPAPAPAPTPTPTNRGAATTPDTTATATATASTTATARLPDAGTARSAAAGFAGATRS